MSLFSKPGNKVPTASHNTFTSIPVADHRDQWLRWWAPGLVIGLILILSVFSIFIVNFSRPYVPPAAEAREEYDGPLLVKSMPDGAGCILPFDKVMQGENHVPVMW